MILYIQRHGEAGEGYPDEIRELTERGIRQVGEVAHSYVGQISVLSQIQASPLVRAQQTATIASEVFSFSGQISINEHLTPWSSSQDFLNSLDYGLIAVYAASHQPFVGDLVHHLTGVSVAVPTSTLFAIEIDYPAEGGGKLLWQTNQKN